MTSIANKPKLKVDLEKVIKIIESVETKAHLDVALRYFFLFSLKYKEGSLSDLEKRLVSAYKSKFWAIVRNKEQHFRF